MPIQFVQKDLGGTIYHDVVDTAPARWDASPAPTVTIRDRAGGELVASQAATAGASTTITQAAAQGSKTLKVTSATGLSVGDVLLLGPNSSGQFEWVTLDSVTTSSLTATVRDKLVYTYASGDAIKSHRLSVAISSAEADAVYQDCRAEWAFEVSDQARIESTTFHISAFSPRMTLRDQDILIRQPRAQDLLGSRQRLEQLIKDVWERDILEDLGSRYNPGALVSGDHLRQAHLYRVLAEISSMAGDTDGRERYFDMYRMAWDRSLPQTLIDVDGDGQIGDDDVVLPALCGRIRRGS